MIYNLVTSITTVLQIHIHIQSNTNADTGRLSCFRHKRFYWLLTSVHWHEERDTILTMLTIPNAAHLVVFKISVGRDPKTPTASSTVENSILYAPMAENSNVCLHGSISTLNCRVFEILKFSVLLFWVWRHPCSSPIFCLGFIMTMVIVISFAR